MGKVELIKKTDARTALWAMLTDPRTIEETEKTALAVMTGSMLNGWIRDTAGGAFRNAYSVVSHDGKDQGTIGLLTSRDEEGRLSTQTAWRVEYELELESGRTLQDAVDSGELANMVYDNLGIDTIDYPSSLLFVDYLANHEVIAYLGFGNFTQFKSSLLGKGLVPSGSVVLNP